MKYFSRFVAIFALIFFNGTVMASSTDLSKDKILNISFFEVNRGGVNRLIFEESMTLPKDRSKQIITVETAEKSGVFSAPITIEGVASTESTAAIEIAWRKKVQVYRLLDYYDPFETPKNTNRFTLLVQPQVFDKMQSRARINVENKEYEAVFSWAEGSTLPITSKTLHIEIFQENNVNTAVSWNVRSKDIEKNEKSSVHSKIEGLRLLLSNGETKDIEGFSDILFNMEDPNFIVLKLDVYSIKMGTIGEDIIIPFAYGTKVYQNIRLLDGQTHEGRFTLKIDGEPLGLIYKLKWL